MVSPLSPPPNPQSAHGQPVDPPNPQAAHGQPVDLPTSSPFVLSPSKGQRTVAQNTPPLSHGQPVTPSPQSVRPEPRRRATDGRTKHPPQYMVSPSTQPPPEILTFLGSHRRGNHGKFQESQKGHSKGPGHKPGSFNCPGRARLVLAGKVASLWQLWWRVESGVGDWVRQGV